MGVFRRLRTFSRSYTEPFVLQTRVRRLSDTSSVSLFRGPDFRVKPPRRKIGLISAIRLQDAPLPFLMELGEKPDRTGERA